MSKDSTEPDRRHYRRFDAAIQVRPVSILARAVPQRVRDVSLGGLRTYTDEVYRVGARLELELLFRDQPHAVVLAEVVWSQASSKGTPARFEVGLRYIDAAEPDLDLIRRALAAQGNGPETPASAA